jgi:hypothetical protein
MNYKNILGFIASNIRNPKNGETILGVWKNENHLQQWMEANPDVEVEDFRMLRVPSSLLPLEIKGSKEDVIIMGIAIGEKEDYSDIRVVHYEYGSL